MHPPPTGHMDPNIPPELNHAQFPPHMDPNFANMVPRPQHQQQQTMMMEPEPLTMHPDYLPPDYDQRLSHPEFMPPSQQQQLQQQQLQQQQQPPAVVVEQGMPAMQQPAGLPDMIYAPPTQEPVVSAPAMPQQFLPTPGQVSSSLVAPSSSDANLMPPPPAPPRKAKKKRVTFDPDIPDDEPSTTRRHTGYRTGSTEVCPCGAQVTSSFTPQTPQVPSQPRAGILVKPAVSLASVTPGVAGQVVQPNPGVVLPVNQGLPQTTQPAAETTVTFMTPDGMLVTQTIRPINSNEAMQPNLVHIQQPSQTPVEDIPAPPPAKTKARHSGLPPHWKTAKDAQGKVYYYHSKTRLFVTVGEMISRGGSVDPTRGIAYIGKTVAK
ncbi:putative microtubule-associated protein futsch isoform X2 [Apostichopus japonicus]|uniref:Putative microtubule-associated protein futsch isoform X2 n=1 Tax=Stichopus japonicus TaxID=307972 RepID=A0A2G8LFY0_STIJA|nr:putative microtubule-associated protein futsch isoform X2 [Apostichopus japonicus]